MSAPRYIRLTKDDGRACFAAANAIVWMGEHEADDGEKLTEISNGIDCFYVRETPAEILALLDAAPADEVTDEAVDAACTAYRLATSGRDVAWRDDMRAAIEAALRVMRGQR